MNTAPINKLPEDTNMRTHYYGIIRKSTKPEDRQAASLPKQARRVDKFAKENKLHLVKTFREKGSAWISDDSRDVFDELVSTIMADPEAKGIIGFNSERLTRNNRDLDTLQKLIIRGHITHILTTTGQVFDINNLSMLGVQTQFDFEYSLKTSQNVKGSIVDRLERGVAPYGTLPPGYVWDPKAPKGKKTPLPNEYFPVVGKVFKILMATNCSVASLWKQAKDMGLRNTHGRVISKSRLHQMLRDPFYKGDFMFKGKLYNGVHQALLTEDEFELVQEILVGKSKPKPKRHEFTLNSFIKCGCGCDKFYTGDHHEKGNGKVYRYYKPSKACGQPGIPEKDLEDQVSQFLSQLKLDPDWVDFGIKWAVGLEEEELRTQEVVTKTIRTAYDSTVKQITNLLKTKAELGEALETEEFNTELQKLLSNKKQLKKQLDSVDEKMDESIELTKRTINYAATACERFQNGSLEEKKTVVRAVGSNLVILDRNLTIQPRKPFKVILEHIQARAYKNQRLELTENVVFSANSEPSDIKLSSERG